MRSTIRILLLSFIGALAYTHLHYGESGLIPDPTTDHTPIVFSILIANIYGFLHIHLNRIWGKILEWKRYFTARFVLGLLLNAIAGVAVISAMTFLYLDLFSESSLPEFLSLHVDSVIKLGILLFFALFILNIIDFTFYSYNEYAVGQIESVKLEREHMELQFEALKTQLSPHYLFNCLNTISSLVDKNAEFAETFIRRLVQTYQYILDSKEKKLVTLAKEVDFVKAYQFLLKVRFGDAMKINFDLSDEILETVIPPLTLQILIENAVKHNEMTEEHPLEIDINMDKGGFINVTNDKIEGAADEVTSFKVGLDNIQKRYKYFTDKPITINDNHQFVVKLPLIPAA